MSSLNENQLRYLLSLFRQVDRILAEALRLTEAEAPSPFDRLRRDVPPDKGALFRARVARVRSLLLSGLEGLGIAPPEPQGSARWAIDTSIRSARISLSELRRDALRRYGAVDRGTAAKIEVLAIELEELLDEAASAIR